MIINKIHIHTPLGSMIACATDKGINLLEFHDRKNIEKQLSSIENNFEHNEIIEQSNNLLDMLKEELVLYFSGNLNKFSVPLDISGTDFQKEVWNVLLKIPYGKTISYIQQARLMNKPEGVRAVANANSKNRIAIIIPCHRVIGSNGTLTGYAGGIERKKWLLDLENPNKRLFE